MEKSGYRYTELPIIVVGKLNTSKHLL